VTVWKSIQSLRLVEGGIKVSGDFGSNQHRSATTVQGIITYLLTRWSRAPLEKLPGSAASQEVPRIFGTRRFITVPTSARHLSLS
jgi:hypothetical protein